MRNPNGAASLLKASKILVVDDEPILRECVRFELEMEGATVVEAASGREAFAQIQAQQFDLVISDVRMPNGDGIELLENVKDLESQTLPILLISGYSDLTQAHAYASGCRGYLEKPCDPNHLVQRAKRALSTFDLAWAESSGLAGVPKVFAVKAESSSAVTQSDDFTLARGGMFVARTSDFPKINTLVRIDLIWASQSETPVSLSGLVRWVRNQPDGSKPAGFGLEFYDLSSAAQELMRSLLPELTAIGKAYIPEC